MQKNLPISNYANFSANAQIYTKIGLKQSSDIEGFHNIPCFVYFHEITGKKHSYHDFVKLVLKYPYFF